jgi:hypothetical protein
MIHIIVAHMEVRSIVDSYQASRRWLRNDLPATTWGFDHSDLSKLSYLTKNMNSIRSLSSLVFNAVPTSRFCTQIMSPCLGFGLKGSARRAIP